MTKIILFDEKAKDIIPGITSDYSFFDIPIWGNYRLKYFVEFITTVYRDMGFELITIKWEDVEKLKKILNSVDLDRCFMLRVSNLVLSKLQNFENIDDGPVKLSINNIPTDLYYLQKTAIFALLEELPTIPAVDDLFEKYFFKSFARIINRDGHAFLMRNANEFYRENIKLMEYQKDEEILSIFKRMPVLYNAETYIGGNVINSYIAPGSIVMGDVKNSVIFGGVEIGRGSIVDSSVILPGNKLEEDVMVKNSLILGGTSRIIGRGSRIGRGPEKPVEMSHPFILKDGLTIIGENVNIPDYSEIGSFCIIEGDGTPGDRLNVDDGNHLLIDA